jgi:hypothetical protein
MRITGCDLNARQQMIAVLDTETGELVEKALQHEGDSVRQLIRRTAEACACWDRGHQVDAVVSEVDGRAQDRLPGGSSGEDPGGRAAQAEARSAGRATASEAAGRKSLSSNLDAFGRATRPAAPSSLGADADATGQHRVDEVTRAERLGWTRMKTSDGCGESYAAAEGVFGQRAGCARTNQKPNQEPLDTAGVVRDVSLWLVRFGQGFDVWAEAHTPLRSGSVPLSWLFANLRQADLIATYASRGTRETRESKRGRMAAWMAPQGRPGVRPPLGKRPRSRCHSPRFASPTGRTRERRQGIGFEENTLTRVSARLQRLFSDDF